MFQGALAKKPYNPILGETFHCSWKVPCTSKPHKPSTNSHIENATTATDDGKVTFVAEQVSHHPPSEYESLRSDKWLTFETSSSECLYGGQLTLSTSFIEPNSHLENILTVVLHRLYKCLILLKRETPYVTI